MQSALKNTFQQLQAQVAAVDIKPYLVLDGAWQEELAAKVRAHEKGWEPLMGAPAEPKQAAHRRSPLLVDVQEHGFALDQWLEGGFADKIGIVVFSRRPIEALRRSLKRFLTVLTPESARPVYLRFYDARTLYCFLRFGFAEQWQDFFRDIEVIAAPYDYSPGWALYKLEEGVLRFGVENQARTGWTWFTQKNADRAAEHYKAAFPFRTIGQQQYNDMMKCAELSFYHEIYEFLAKAFPKQMEGIKKQDTMTFITKAHRIASQNGFDGSPECLYYWSVLSFCGGFEFYKRGNVQRILRREDHSQETRLEVLIFNMGCVLENNHLIELADVIECKIDYAGGGYVVYRERSGTIVEQSDHGGG